MDLSLVDNAGLKRHGINPTYADVSKSVPSDFFWTEKGEGRDAEHNHEPASLSKTVDNILEMRLKKRHDPFLQFSEFWTSL